MQMLSPYLADTSAVEGVQRGVLGVYASSRQGRHFAACFDEMFEIPLV